MMSSSLLYSVSVSKSSFAKFEGIVPSNSATVLYCSTAWYSASTAGPAAAW